MSDSISYRPDIDGLRAMAVLSVILFHLGGTPLHGGFVGVDIFFVISGYLITNIILKSLDAGNFSLAHFYERRILRIFPALFLVLFSTTIAGTVLLFPKDFDYFGETLSAAAAFGSNFIFWNKSGYFEASVITIPLLHTWSLAVEEQFYIFFPLCLMFIHKFFKKYLVFAVVAGLCLSLGLAVFLAHKGAMVALFYLLPSRAWELLIGSMLAFSFLPKTLSPKIMNLISVSGMALIVYAVFYFDKDTVFPGLTALVPTLGAACILYSGTSRQSLSYQLLSHKIPVFFGRISYSLYLWHWPLIVFVTYASPVSPTGWMSVGIFLLCVGLAFLSWKFVEQPVRYNLKLSRRKIFALAFAGSLAFIGVGTLISKQEGFPNRFSEEIQKTYNVAIGKPLPPIPDLKVVNEYTYNGVLGDPKAVPSFVLWGDSHAYAASPGVDLAAKDAGRKGYFLALSGCFPVLTEVQKELKFCHQFNTYMITFLKAHPDIRTVILVAHWRMHEKKLAKDFAKGKINSATILRDSLDVLLTQLEKTGHKIVFMKDMPEAPVDDVPLYITRAVYYGADMNLTSDIAAYDIQEQNVTSILAELAKKHDFKIVDPTTVFCAGGTCPISRDGKSLYLDENHISAYGSQLYKDMYAPLFKD